MAGEEFVNCRSVEAVAKLFRPKTSEKLSLWVGTFFLRIEVFWIAKTKPVERCMRKTKNKVCMTISGLLQALMIIFNDISAKNCPKNDFFSISLAPNFNFLHTLFGRTVDMVFGLVSSRTHKILSGHGKCLAMNPIEDNPSQFSRCIFIFDRQFKADTRNLQSSCYWASFYLECLLWTFANLEQKTLWI